MSMFLFQFSINKIRLLILTLHYQFINNTKKQIIDFY